LRKRKSKFSLPPPKGGGWAIVLLIALIGCLALPAQAAPAEAAHLSAQDRADINRIEFYLNDLKNIAADFLQIDDRGGMLHGKLEIQRPGKMRATYDPPSADFIIADGDQVHIWNGELKSQTSVEEGSSLANFILRDPIRLGGDVTIVKFQRMPAKLELTLAQTKDPGAGSLTLIFEDHPLILRQWRVVDAQGRTTGVNLENERMDVSFPENNFKFIPPNFGVRN
jgi:outer membrane lipoprotein-sorting protein